MAYFFAFLISVGFLIPQTSFAEPSHFFKFGSLGSDDDELDEPSDITIDSSGNLIYVIDRDNHRVNVFDDNGNDEFNFGSFCRISTNQECNDDAPKAVVDGDGQFNQPSGIAIGLFGDIYVTDSENNRVQRFDSDGDYETKFGSSSGDDQDYLGSPTAITIQKSTGDIYVTDTDKNSISVFDLFGDFLFKFGSSGSDDGEFRNPSGLLIDTSKDILYVADTDNDRIQIFELVDDNKCPSGTQEIVDGVCFVNEFGSSGSDDGEFNSPTGLALDESKDLLYVADTDNDRIQIFELVDDSKCPSGTQEIVDGVCFVNEFGSSGSDDGEFNSPTGLALDESKDLLYVADTDNNRIQVFVTTIIKDEVPDPPINIDASAASLTSIMLVWTQPSLDEQIPAVTGYKIEYRKHGEDYSTLVADTKNTNTFFLHERLETDETYTYRVYAINSEGVSGASLSSSAKPHTTTVPSGLTATAISPNSIRLLWNSPSETFGQPVTGYTIKQELIPGIYEDIVKIDDQFTTHVVTRLTTGKMYTFVVIANFPLGSSDVSNIASAIPEEDSTDTSSSSSSSSSFLVTLPNPPRHLTAISTSNQIELSWDEPSYDGNSSIIGYKIEIKNDNREYFTLVENTKNTDTTYTHTTVLPDIDYTYRISAINSVGVSDTSKEVSVALKESPLEIKPLDTFNIDEGKTLSFNVNLVDNSWNGVIFSLDKQPPSGAMIDSNTAKFTWTPTASQGPGTYVFDIVAKKDSVQDRQSITIQVNDVLDTVSKIIPKELLIPAPFVDDSKDPQSYVDRYFNELDYQKWFDDNYSEYSSIYEAVGLDEPLSEKESKLKQPPSESVSKLAPFVDPNEDPKYYIDRYDTEPSYKNWFDKNYPDYDIYEAVGLDEPLPKKELIVEKPQNKSKASMGICGENTILVDGVCQIKENHVKLRQKTCFLFWCW